MFTSINPATGETFATFDEISPEQLEQKLTIAHETFGLWRETSFAHRAERMKRLAAILRDRKRPLGELATKEMGKPITQAMAEVEKCAWACEYFAAEAAQMLTPEIVKSEASESYIRFDPLGVILLVMPWNFPFWQVLRVSAPTIMAGNTVVLKHASNVPQCALAIENLFREAGFPEGVFQTLLVNSGMVEKIVRHSAIQGVSLTGSERAGSIVASIAASEIKKSVMELGGSDAFIVLDDADLDRTCDIAVTARIQNNGQSCIAAKRFIVMESIAEAFTHKFAEILQAKIVGDPMDEATQIGPLVSEVALTEIHGQVERSVAQGAKIILGGKRGNRPGSFYEPTILANVQKGMPAYDEEIFGYVASIITVKDEHEAVRVANDTRYGLGASIWTQNMSRAKALIPKLHTGSVFVNDMVKSDPRLPVGGTKKYGYGRELSHYGLKEFTNIKTVWIK